MSYLIPGELIPEDGFIELNKGRETTTLKVANTSDRPIQIGSHYPVSYTHLTLPTTD